MWHFFFLDGLLLRHIFIGVCVSQHVVQLCILFKFNSFFFSVPCKPFIYLESQTPLKPPTTTITTKQKTKKHKKLFNLSVDTFFCVYVSLHTSSILKILPFSLKSVLSWNFLSLSTYKETGLVWSPASKISSERLILVETQTQIKPSTNTPSHLKH